MNNFSHSQSNYIYPSSNNSNLYNTQQSSNTITTNSSIPFKSPLSSNINYDNIKHQRQNFNLGKESNQLDDESSLNTKDSKQVKIRTITKKNQEDEREFNTNQSVNMNNNNIANKLRNNNVAKSVSQQIKINNNSNRVKNMAQQNLNKYNSSNVNVNNANNNRNQKLNQNEKKMDIDDSDDDEDDEDGDDDQDYDDFDNILRESINIRNTQLALSNSNTMNISQKNPFNKIDNNNSQNAPKQNNINKYNSSNINKSSNNNNPIKNINPNRNIIKNKQSNNNNNNTNDNIKDNTNVNNVLDQLKKGPKQIVNKANDIIDKAENKIDTISNKVNEKGNNNITNNIDNKNNPIEDKIKQMPKKLKEKANKLFNNKINNDNDNDSNNNYLDKLKQIPKEMKEKASNIIDNNLNKMNSDFKDNDTNDKFGNIINDNLGKLEKVKDDAEKKLIDLNNYFGEDNEGLGEENNEFNIMNFDEPKLINQDNIEKIKDNLGLEGNNKISDIFDNNNLVPEKVSNEINKKIDSLLNPPMSNMNLDNNFDNKNTNFDIDNNNILNNNDNDNDINNDNDNENDIFNDIDDNNNFDINNNINNSNNGFNDKHNIIENNLNNINLDDNNIINESESKIDLDNPQIKNQFINHNIAIDNMLKDMKFLERLKSISNDRYSLFIKKYQNENYFMEKGQFENIFIDEKNIQIESPLTLIFHHIFNPDIPLSQSDNFFFETVFTKRGDHNYSISYDKAELKEIPKYFDDFSYVNHLFNDFNQNDLNSFLEEINSWKETFSFEQQFIHPLLNKFKNYNSITMKDVAKVYFISPYDLIIDYHSWGSDLPLSDTFIAITQYRFHCEIDFNRKKGKFTFKTSGQIFNTLRFIKKTLLQNTIRTESNSTNKEELQINTWPPLKAVIDSEDKKNQEKVKKIYNNHLLNNLNKYSKELPEEYNIFNADNEDNWNSFSDLSENGESKAYKEDIMREDWKKDLEDRNVTILKYGGIFIVALFSIKILRTLTSGTFSFSTLFHIILVALLGYVLIKNH